MSYGLKDAIAFFHGASFSVRKWGATGEEKQKHHQDLGDMEVTERLDNAYEEDGERSVRESTAPAGIFGWKISAFSLSKR